MFNNPSLVSSRITNREGVRYTPGSKVHVLRMYIVRVLHKVHIYKEYHSVCPLVGIGSLPPPLSPASVPLPPEPKEGGGAHSSAGEGVGVCQF